MSEGYILSKSYLPNKKFMVITPSGQKIHFGSFGYSDFTKHKDLQRKENYLSRHSTREDWTDLSKAGTWSRYILWNKPTLSGSIKDMEKRFGIKIKYSL